MASCMLMCLCVLVVDYYLRNLRNLWISPLKELLAFPLVAIYKPAFVQSASKEIPNEQHADDRRRRGNRRSDYRVDFYAKE